MGISACMSKEIIKHLLEVASSQQHLMCWYHSSGQTSLVHVLDSCMCKQLSQMQHVVLDMRGNVASFQMVHALLAAQGKLAAPSSLPRPVHACHVIGQSLSDHLQHRRVKSQGAQDHCGLDIQSASIPRIASYKQQHALHSHTHSTERERDQDKE